MPYLGFGAGAHGYYGGLRIANMLGIREYIESFRVGNNVVRNNTVEKNTVGTNAVGNNAEFPVSSAGAFVTRVDRFTEMQETMLVGLRLTLTGINAEAFSERFRIALGDVFGYEITPLISQGLLEWTGEDEQNLRLTPRGRLLGNRVFMQFVGVRED